MIYFVGRRGRFRFVAGTILVVLGLGCAFASLAVPSHQLGSSNTASIHSSNSIQHDESHHQVLKKPLEGMLHSMQNANDAYLAFHNESTAHLAPMMEQFSNSFNKSQSPVSLFETKGPFVLVEPVNSKVKTSRRGLRHRDTKLNLESKVLHLALKYWIVILLVVVVTVCCSCDCRTFCCGIMGPKDCPDAAFDETCSFPSLDVAPPSSSSEATTATPPRRSSLSPSDSILFTIMSPSYPLATILEHHNEDGDESTRSKQQLQPVHVAWVSPLAKRRARRMEEKDEDEI